MAVGSQFAVIQVSLQHNNMLLLKHTVQLGPLTLSQQPTHLTNTGIRAIWCVVQASEQSRVEESKTGPVKKYNNVGVSQEGESERQKERQTERERDRKRETD